MNLTHSRLRQPLIEELGRHGYKLSAGTLYPMLHAMERRGYLTSRVERAGRSQRRIYRTTTLAGGETQPWPTDAVSDYIAATM